MHRRMGMMCGVMRKWVRVWGKVPQQQIHEEIVVMNAPSSKAKPFVSKVVYVQQENINTTLTVSLSQSVLYVNNIPRIVKSDLRVPLRRERVPKTPASCKSAVCEVTKGSEGLTFFYFQTSNKVLV